MNPVEHSNEFVLWLAEQRLVATTDPNAVLAAALVAWGGLNDVALSTIPQAQEAAPASALVDIRDHAVYVSRTSTGEVFFTTARDYDLQTRGGVSRILRAVNAATPQAVQGAMISLGLYPVTPETFARDLARSLPASFAYSDEVEAQHDWILRVQRPPSVPPAAEPLPEWLRPLVQVYEGRPLIKMAHEAQSEADFVGEGTWRSSQKSMVFHALLDNGIHGGRKQSRFKKEHTDKVDPALVDLVDHFDERWREFLGGQVYRALMNLPLPPWNPALTAMGITEGTKLPDELRAAQSELRRRVTQVLAGKDSTWVDAYMHLHEMPFVAGLLERAGAGYYGTSGWIYNSFNRAGLRTHLPYPTPPTFGKAEKAQEWLQEVTSMPSVTLPFTVTATKKWDTYAVEVHLGDDRCGWAEEKTLKKALAEAVTSRRIWEQVWHLRFAQLGDQFASVDGAFARFRLQIDDRDFRAGLRGDWDMPVPAVVSPAVESTAPVESAAQPPPVAEVPVPPVILKVKVLANYWARTLREAFPAIVNQVVKTEKSGDYLYLHLPIEAVRFLAEVTLPKGGDWGAAEELGASVTRALKAYEKNNAAAMAEASGDLRPEHRDLLEKILKRRVIDGMWKKLMPVLGPLGLTVTKTAADTWVIALGDHHFENEKEPTANDVVTPHIYRLAGRTHQIVMGVDKAGAVALTAKLTAYLQELRRRVAERLGVPLPEDKEAAAAWLEENGFTRPAKPKGLVRGEWTCAACFRVHARDAAGLIVHHGYRRPGVGYIIGDCEGVGFRPWEHSSTDITPRILESAEQGSRDLMHFLRTTPTRFRRPVRGKNGETTLEEITPSHPDWPEVLAAQRVEAASMLAYRWSGHFQSIPWFRMALRTWVYSETGAVGAPDNPFIPEDFAGWAEAKQALERTYGKPVKTPWKAPGELDPREQVLGKENGAQQEDVMLVQRLRVSADAEDVQEGYEDFLAWVRGRAQAGDADCARALPMLAGPRGVQLYERLERHVRTTPAPSAPKPPPPPKGRTVAFGGGGNPVPRYKVGDYVWDRQHPNYRGVIETVGAYDAFLKQYRYHVRDGGGQLRWWNEGSMVRGDTPRGPAPAAPAPSPSSATTTPPSVAPVQGPAIVSVRIGDVAFSDEEDHPTYPGVQAAEEYLTSLWEKRGQKKGTRAFFTLIWSDGTEFMGEVAYPNSTDMVKEGRTYLTNLTMKSKTPAARRMVAQAKRITEQQLSADAEALLHRQWNRG